MACKPRDIKSYPKHLHECKKMTVKDLLLLNTLDECCYTIQGHISFIQACPPCPKGVLCKPCPPNAIYITDTFQKDFDYKSSIRLFVDSKKIKQFKLGNYGSYSFLSNNDARSINDTYYRLLGYNVYPKQIP